MSRLRRHYKAGHSYFITCVTFERRKVLIDNIDLLYRSLEKVTAESHVVINTYVILPDHFHMILEPGDHDFSVVVQRLKMSFGSYFRGRQKLRRGRIWQHRFWDHLIRDEEDLLRHIDYIHYNPVKHGLAISPHDWRHSSISDYCEQGYYQRDWGSNNKMSFDGEYGE